MTGIILLVVGTVISLYSPWLQQSLRAKIVERLNSRPGLSVSLDEFSIRFPLTVRVGGLSLAQNGDTLIAARRLDADISLLPLIKGKVSSPEIDLDGGRFTLGSPDSAMYMVIDGRAISLNDVSVGLGDMSIDIGRGRLDGAKVDMVITPDTTTTASATEPSTMSIALHDLALHDLVYNMRLLPSIDSLGVTIADGSLTEGLIDMASQHIGLDAFVVRGLDAAYIAPDSATVAATPVPAQSDTTAASKPWSVEIDTISIRGSQALYATRGLSPLPGLDFGYIEVDSLDLDISDFFNQATTLRLPLQLSGRERCGVSLSASGTFALDSAAMHLDEFKVSTPRGTDLAVNALMGMGDLTKDPALPLRLDASGGIAAGDLRDMFPAFTPYLITLPQKNQLKIDVLADGSPADLKLSRLDAGINGCVSIKSSGRIANLTDPRRMKGNINISGHIINVTAIKNSLLDKATAKAVNIPPMMIRGNVAIDAMTVNGKVNVTSGHGDIALTGRWNSDGESYRADVTVDSFPVETFMPALGFGHVTARLHADGHGYNPFGTKMVADASLVIKSAVYNNYNYTDITADASVRNGRAQIKLSSDNPDARIGLTASGNLDGDTCRWVIEADADDVDLKALKFSDIETAVSFALGGNATFNRRTGDIDAGLNLKDFSYRRPDSDISLSGILARFCTRDSLTQLDIHNRDMTANLTVPSSLDSLIARATDVSTVLSRQIAAQSIDVHQLQQSLPKFILDVVAGDDNAITDVMQSSKMTLSHLNISASNDSTLTLESRITGFRTPSTKLDTITFDLGQQRQYLGFRAHVGNRPGSFDQWADVSLNGYLFANQAGLRLRQHNIAGKCGFDVGLQASVADSTATVSLTPLDQIIGYKPWNINEDNFISYNFATRHIDADLTMTGDGSKVRIMTEHTDGATGQEDLVINLSDIRLSDWISINPFAPAIKGMLNADLRLRHDDGRLTGKGSAGIDDFYYGRDRVASFKVDFDVSARPGGQLWANSNVFVDGYKTMTLSGSLNDSTSTSPYNLDFSMIRFPLSTVNPFLPPRVAKLKGTLNGTMRISGDSENPVMDGYLDFDSTSVFLYMTGTDYRFSDEKIPVDSSLVSFNGFRIFGVNDNPLGINGTVDISSLSSPKIDLQLNADNMQLLNTRRPSKGADIYGKAFISLDAKVKGNTELMFVNADLRIVPPTNVTYVIPASTNTLSSHAADDMVRFVNFTDTTQVERVDSITGQSMAMILDASLTVENGTTIGVEMTGGRGQIQADGTVNYTMSPLSDGRMTGRININGGYVRYSPPFMSEKNFSFSDNSYIAFNGDVTNPTVDIHATDIIKANVTQSGQNSRLVNFDVELNVTGTLDRLDVSFDLATNDDVTVANELQSMSADQRANQAMNMMLYGIYTGPNTKGDASLSGNALNAFLASQINTWAANNIKGVDLSFGIDQYDRTIDGSSSQTTSYSYQVSKSMFNDRFKIVIGGNYSTDANADENFSQNLINDISFEYFLNKGHTMYVRIFRHTGYESILEGEITQTGVGFVYRRKLNRLGDMFKFLKRRPKNDETKDAPK